MQGWQMTFPQSLGMPFVTDEKSFLLNTTPAPRVLQNQLDHGLEQYCAMKEERYLKALSSTMLLKRSNAWAAIFISAVILLHVRERDIHRLLYWTLDISNGCPKHSAGLTTLIQSRRTHGDTLTLHAL